MKLFAASNISRNKLRCNVSWDKFIKKLKSGTNLCPLNLIELLTISAVGINNHEGKRKWEWNFLYLYLTGWLCPRKKGSSTLGKGASWCNNLVWIGFLCSGVNNSNSFLAWTATTTLKLTKNRESSVLLYIVDKRWWISRFGKSICLGQKISQMARTEFRILSFKPLILYLLYLQYCLFMFGTIFKIILKGVVFRQKAPQSSQKDKWFYENGISLNSDC